MMYDSHVIHNCIFNINCYILLSTKTEICIYLLILSLKVYIYLDYYCSATPFQNTTNMQQIYIGMDLQNLCMESIIIEQS